jgi:hypothetical protein
MNERAISNDTASITALIEPTSERGKWRCDWRIDKWNDSGDFSAGLPPDEVLTVEGNLLVNSGIQLLEDLLVGAGGTAYSSGVNAALAVGSDSATPPAATQTALVAELARKVATATVSAQTVTFQATFTAGQGTGSWNEAGAFNNPTSGGTMLNRMQQALGTKPAGATWVLTMNITIS